MNRFSTFSGIRQALLDLNAQLGTIETAQGSGAVSGGGDTKVLTTSGTWTNPSPGVRRRVEILMIGGGAGSGGGGGGCAQVHRQVTEVVAQMA